MCVRPVYVDIYTIYPSPREAIIAIAADNPWFNGIRVIGAGGRGVRTYVYMYTRDAPARVRLCIFIVTYFLSPVQYRARYVVSGVIVRRLVRLPLLSLGIVFAFFPRTTIAARAPARAISMIIRL